MAGHYLSGLPLDRDTIVKFVPIMLDQVRQYVNEMGVMDTLYQLIANTEPSRIVVYNGDQSRKLIPEVDPTYDEIRIAYLARRYQISTSDVRKREQYGSVVCKRVIDFKEWLDCTEAAMWGLSGLVYNNRRAISKIECQLTPDEEYLHVTTPSVLWWDSPSAQKIDDCERKIMLGHS